MKRHPATTLVVDVRRGNIFMAVVGVARVERHNHPSKYTGSLGLAQCSRSFEVDTGGIM